MSWGGYITGDMLRDPAFMQALSSSYMEEWAPEDEGDEEKFVEDVGEEWRLVDSDGGERNFKHGKLSRYKSFAGAKIACSRYRRDFGITVTPQKGKVKWDDLG